MKISKNRLKPSFRVSVGSVMVGLHPALGEHASRILLLKMLDAEMAPDGLVPVDGRELPSTEVWSRASSSQERRDGLDDVGFAAAVRTADHVYATGRCLIGRIGELQFRARLEVRDTNGLYEVRHVLVRQC